MERYKPTLQGLGTIVAIVIALVGATNSVFGFVKKNLFSEHVLQIDIAGVHTVGHLVHYVIVFTNNGDYPEVVTDIQSYLGQKVEGYKNPTLNAMSYCFTPFVVKPHDYHVITYTTKYYTNRPVMHSIPQLRQVFLPMLEFVVRGEPSGVIEKFVRVGRIDKDSFDFETQRVNINFEKPRPQVVLGPFPVKKQYATPSLCPSGSPLAED